MRTTTMTRKGQVTIPTEIRQALGLVENDERVAIDLPGVGTFREPVSATALNEPRAGTDEALARHGGKGGEDGGRGDVVGAAQLLRIHAPRGFDRIGHGRLHRADRRRSRDLEQGRRRLTLAL